jgi:hypothetical protein
VTHHPSLIHRLLRRLAAQQEGFILVISLGATTVLAIVGTGAALYSTQNYGHASRSKADQQAYSLAEAGVNNAMAVLSVPGQNPLNPALLPERTSPYEGGSVTWSGTLNELTGVWTLSSVANVRNPTGPNAAPLRRRVTATVPTVQTTPQALTNLAWNYVYSRAKGGTCDMSIGNTVTIGSPLYVAGNLCLQNSASITRGPLVVNGYMTMAQTTNAVGSVAAPISEAHIAGGCKWYTQLLHNPCLLGAGTAGKDNVWASTLDAVPGTIAAPTPDVNSWFLNASPGPYYPCALVGGTPPVFDNDQGPRTSPDVAKRNDSLNASAAIDLTPAASYTCATEAGELSWDAGARKLTVRGTIFIDGSAKITNSLVNSYTGQASLYLSGTLFVKNSKLCAVVSADGTTCTQTGWDPNSRLLAIIAMGTGAWGGAAIQVYPGDSIQLVGSYVQAAMYAQYAIDLDTTSKVDGPLNANTVKLSQSVTTSFPAFSTVPVGMPGNPVLFAQLGPVGGYSG